MRRDLSVGERWEGSIVLGGPLEFTLRAVRGQPSHLAWNLQRLRLLTLDQRHFRVLRGYQDGPFEVLP